MTETPPAIGKINLLVAEISAVGARKSNQDALGKAQQDDLACFIVSDGTGGHQGGEVAANLVVDSIKQIFLKESCFGERALRAYIDYAISQVAHDRMRAQEQHDMSATVAALLFDQSNRCALWAHMGDTRIYMFRNSKIFRITKDHSLAQRMVEAGYTEASRLREHPQRSILFAAIGAEGNTAPDVTQQAVDICDGDAFLVCTDGLWEWVMEADMERTLLYSTSTQQWLDSMNRIAEENVRAANRPRDNYSAFAIWLSESPTVK